MKTKLALLLLAAGSLLYAQENNLVRNGKIDQKPKQRTDCRRDVLLSMPPAGDTGMQKEVKAKSGSSMEKMQASMMILQFSSRT